jgi:hypothetical protein
MSQTPLHLRDYTINGTLQKVTEEEIKLLEYYKKRNEALELKKKQGIKRSFLAPIASQVLYLYSIVLMMLIIINICISISIDAGSRKT